jgi:hypothetical protein
MTKELRIPKKESEYLAMSGRKSKKGVAFESTGEEVKRLQKALLELKYRLPKYGVDGKFGPETDAAVQAFQDDHNDRFATRHGKQPLLVDGIVGPKTALALNCALAEAGKGFKDYEHIRTDEEDAPLIHSVKGNRASGIKLPEGKRKEGIVRFAREPEFFLEIELFDLSKKNETKSDYIENFRLYVGDGNCANANSFEEFKKDCAREIQRGNVEEVQANTKVLQVPIKDYLEKTMKIQAMRNKVARKYDDGNNGWYVEIEGPEGGARIPGPNAETLVVKLEDKKGKWPRRVELSYQEAPWPTEEHLVRISCLKSEESYNKRKKEATVPLLNKVIIFERGEEIEYVVE